MNAVYNAHDRWRVAPREIEDNETLISIEDNDLTTGNENIKRIENRESDMLVFVNEEPVDVWYEH